jgi:hypothetical protein
MMEAHKDITWNKVVPLKISLFLWDFSITDYLQHTIWCVVRCILRIRRCV